MTEITWKVTEWLINMPFSHIKLPFLFQSPFSWLSANVSSCDGTQTHYINIISIEVLEFSLKNNKLAACHRTLKKVTQFEKKNSKCDRLIIRIIILIKYFFSKCVVKIHQYFCLLWGRLKQFKNMFKSQVQEMQLNLSFFF